MKQNNPCYLFGMYGPDTGFVIINAINDTYTGTPIVISCEEYNSAELYSSQLITIGVPVYVSLMALIITKPVSGPYMPNR